MKQQWCEAVSELDALIESSGIDRRKFNRGNQAKWIEKITAWAQEETKIINYPRRWGNFHSVLAERTKAGGVTPQHPLFVAIDNLLGEPLSIKDLVLTRALSEIRETVAQENDGAASWDLTICSAV